MPKALVIVESPGKAKTINKYLGKQYVVMASLGHIKDLPKKDLAVDVAHGFEPHYEVIEGKKKLLSELKQAAKKVEEVYLAADPDREGEAICYHLQEELGNGKKGPRIFRVMFNEITKKAIEKAFEKPGQVNANLVDAQQARRVLDRLVGYKISPLLWDKVRRGLSAGRVQTVALRVVVEREREIRAFVPKEYWTIDADLNAKKPPLLTARLIRLNDQSAEIGSQQDAQDVVAQTDGADYIVKSVGTREKKRNPVAPFITSTLQQESSRKLRFSVKRTMMLAQRLYEGVEIGKEGAIGLITYMRTDSTRVSDDAISDVRHYIAEHFGKEFLPESANIYKSKKDAQDAHEAIRPTSMALTPEMLETHLAEDEMKLYRLIWNRFVACQMMPALFDQTTIDVAASGKNGLEYIFRATGSVQKFEGFLKVYKEGKDQNDEEDEEEKHRMPLVTEGERLRFKAIRPEQHFTEPPPRYNEATLVKRLEADGVGRPSTYASILSTIQDREYVKKDGGRFLPSELGMVVTDLLLESFDDIFEVKYTARMEEELDEIEEGKLDWRAAMAEFYERFEKDIAHAEEHMTDIKRMEKPTDQVCEKCGKPLVIKWGKHGSFLACTGYPDLSSKNAETDLEKLTSEIDRREVRIRNEVEKTLVKLQVRYPQVLIERANDGRVPTGAGFPKEVRSALAKLEERIDERRLKDSGQIKDRLEKIQARHPQMNEFFDLDLEDTAQGVRLFWKRKEGFCTYTRELTVDLPDVDKANLSEQGEEEYCQNCGRPMVLKKGRFGTFFACTGYPDCKTTKQIGGTQKKPDQPLEEKCPQCGNHLVLKSGRFGEFTACSNYPTCKYVKQKTIGVKCPDCSEGEISERRSRKGKTFYGCTRYPDCKFVAWGKPVAEKCPECGSPYMLEKWLKAGAVWQCPNDECKHKEPVPQPEAVAQ
ncbi:MAG TPA: type I DNA topoisomerase [Bryobacteraceae bacterium]|jgi:DNA topoisomerase-1|nr:type I DNA topoisomerase [Bryobacteraceae bacterium]